MHVCFPPHGLVDTVSCTADVCCWLAVTKHSQSLAFQGATLELYHLTSAGCPAHVLESAVRGSGGWIFKWQQHPPGGLGLVGQLPMRIAWGAATSSLAIRFEPLAALSTLVLLRVLGIATLLSNYNFLLVMLVAKLTVKEINLCQPWGGWTVRMAMWVQERKKTFVFFLFLLLN